MFSSSPSFQIKLVEFSFIAGINKEEIIQDNYKQSYKPKCLFGYPENNEIFSQVAELAYPLDAYILSESEDGPMVFFTTMLTDAKANRTYIYVLKMYETIANLKVKVPVAICFGSRINDTDAFKTLLNEIYMIKTSNYTIPTKQIELLNYLMFVHSILIPPWHSLLRLNMRYMTVDFYFHSRCELPCTLNDNNINILFSVLDVSKVIRLWLNVLREKKVIIYGNRPYLLNAICDAITRLIFPFKWQMAYISCLNKSQLDLLDSPCPAIFGVLSSTITIEELKKKYSSYCIVDLETGHIMSPKTGKLPREVEILLRKNMQIIKNPELFEKEELFKTEKNINELKDSINSKLSFSSNMQRIFFQIMKDQIKDYKNYVDSNNNFEKKRFLNTIQSPEIRCIWEKIIDTLMFDCFIQFTKCKDDCYNRIFDELCNEDKLNQRNITNSFLIELTMPPLKSKNVISILKEINFEDNEFEQMLAQYANETQQSNFLLSARKLSTLSLSPQKPDQLLNYIEKDNKSDHSSDIDNSFELEDFGISPLITIVNNQKEKPQMMFKQKHKSSSMVSEMISSYKSNLYINSVNNVSEKSLNFYSEKGFIAFVVKIINTFENKKYNLNDVLFKKQLFEEIIDLSSKLYNNLKGINFILEEKEGEDMTPIIQKTTPFFQTKTKSKSKANVNNGLNNGLSGSKESGKSSQIDSDTRQIIKMRNTQHNLSQQYLFYAFHLEEIITYPDKTFQKENSEINDYIITFYHQAVLDNPKEFPYYHYSTIINKRPKEQLTLYESDPKLSFVKDIVQEALSNLYKTLRSLSNLKKSIESPRINKKINLYTPATPKYLKRFSSTLFTPDNEKLERQGTLSLRGSSNSKSFLGEENNAKDNILELLSKQMKKERKEMAKSKKKKKDSEILDNTIIQNKEIRDTIKLVPIDITVKEFFMIKDIYFGIEYDFTSPFTLNKHKRVNISSEPLALMIKIGEELIAFINKLKTNALSGSSQEKPNESLKKDFNEIQNAVNKLQRVNLSKLPRTADQYSFWLNAFNFLLIYAILYTNYQPNTFEQWGKLMTNCLYKIGGYEMSLYEIENKILSCCNFHNQEIKFTDPITEKFCIVEDNILIDFALYFPIKNKTFNLTIYLNDKFEEQIYKTAKIFLNNNITYDQNDKSLSITSYFNHIMPTFMEKNFIHYKNHIDSTLYSVLNQKEYLTKVVLDTSWEYSLY